VSPKLELSIVSPKLWAGTKKGGWQGHPPSSSRIYYLNMLLISPQVLGSVPITMQGSSPRVPPMPAQ
jgi:hypothetical protein